MIGYVVIKFHEISFTFCPPFTLRIHKKNFFLTCGYKKIIRRDGKKKCQDDAGFFKVMHRDVPVQHISATRD